MLIGLHGSCGFIAVVGDVFKGEVLYNGGLTILPDSLIDAMVVNAKILLLLPGTNTWENRKHEAILKKAREFLVLGHRGGGSL
ncbi:hypothetical protein [Eubacterium aggregans]|uniref:hypothetical protein n=1 Tax=Eubacterium aggregans TaxID=81409 RepID=UPI003F34139E